MLAVVGTHLRQNRGVDTGAGAGRDEGGDGREEEEGEGEGEGSRAGGAENLRARKSGDDDAGGVHGDQAGSEAMAPARPAKVYQPRGKGGMDGMASVEGVEMV